MADPKLPPGMTLDPQPSGTAALPPGMTLDTQQDTVSAAPKIGSKAWLKSKGYEAIQTVADAAPGVGAMLGGLIGAGAGTGAAPGPGTAAGAVGGAGMGGMAGTAFQQMTRGSMGWDTPQTAAGQATDITKQGLTQAAIQGISEAVPLLAPILKRAGLKQYQSAIYPTGATNKAITAQIAPEMIQRRVTGSLAGIESQAVSHAADLGPKLDQAIADIPNDELAVLLKKYESPATPLGTHEDISAGLAQRRVKQQLGSTASTVPSGIFKDNPLVESVGSQAGALPPNQLFGPKTGTGLEVGTIPGPLHGAMRETSQALDSLKHEYIVDGVVANPTAVKAIQGVQDIVSQFGDSVSPESLRRLRQIFDNPVAKAGGFAGHDLSGMYTLQAQQAAGNSIRKLMAEASPNVAALNREMSFWLKVQQVTENSANRQVGQQGGLLKTLSPLASIPVAAATGAHFGTEAGLGTGAITAAGALMAQAMRSPAWRTTSAVAKNEIAAAMARGSVGQLSTTLARYGLAQAQAQGQTPQK